MNNIGHEASRHFGNKMKEYLKDKTKELAMSSKNKNINGLYRGINEFKRDYQPISNLVKDENGNLLTKAHYILNKVEELLLSVMNVHSVTDVRQIEIYTAEPLIPNTGSLETEIAIAKFKNYKLPCTDKIPAELIQTPMGFHGLLWG
jgi:hypothetical protein